MVLRATDTGAVPSPSWSWIEERLGRDAGRLEAGLGGSTVCARTCGVLLGAVRGSVRVGARSIRPTAVRPSARSNPRHAHDASVTGVTVGYRAEPTPPPKCPPGWDPFVVLAYHDGMTDQRQGAPPRAAASTRSGAPAPRSCRRPEPSSPGATPTVAQAAEAALVSRTTAYRYFPTQESLLIEVAVSVDVDEIEALVARAARPRRRRRPGRRGAQASTATCSTTSPGTARCSAPIPGRVAGRGGRRRRRAGHPRGPAHPVDEHALAPRAAHGAPRRPRPARAALSVLTGVEAVVVLRDVCQLAEDDALAVTSGPPGPSSTPRCPEVDLVGSGGVVALPLTGKSSTCLWSSVVGDVFKALADPTRRAILDELTERDGQTLFELCARLATKHGMGSTRQAISQHLDVLEAAGLVSTRREGRYKFHHLDTAPLRQIADRWSIPEPRGRPMRINVMSVMVDDQAKALRFYTEVLGFVKKREIPLGEHAWLTVVSPEDPDGTELSLEPDEHPAAATVQAGARGGRHPVHVVRGRRRRRRVRAPGRPRRAVHAAARPTWARSPPRCSTTPAAT